MASSTASTDIVRHYIIQHYLDGDTIGFTDETHLLESGILDSLSIFELIHFITENLQIEIPEKELTIENFRSVASISRLLGQIRCTLPPTHSR